MYSSGLAKFQGVLFGLFIGFYSSAAFAGGKPVPDASFLLFESESGLTGNTSEIPFYPQNFWLLQSGALNRVDVDSSTILESRPAKNADALALQPSDGTLWFADNEGIHSVTLDGEPLLDAPIPLPAGEKVSGLAVDDANGLLWAVTDSGLHRISVTGRYLAFIPLGKIVSAPAWMRDRGDVWVLGKHGIEGFSADGSALGRVAVSGMNTPLVLVSTQDGRGAWIADRNSVAGLRSGGTLAAGPWRHGLKHPEFASGDGEGGVWLADRAEIVHLDATGRVTVRFRVPKGAIRALAADRRDGSAWYASNHSAHKLAATGAVVASVDLEKRGGAVMAGALHIDDTLPEIWIHEPEPEIYTNDNTPSLYATYSDYGSRVVIDTLGFTLNDKAITVSCKKDEFSADCVPDEIFEDGYHTLAATIEDLAHNVSKADSVRFTVDTIPPTITVRSPEKHLYTNQPLLDIEGEIDEFAYLHLNDERLLIDANFAFATERLLEEGENVFYFHAEDRATNWSEQTRTTVLDTVPPVLVIQSPKSGYATSSDRVIVQGGVNEPGSVTIGGAEAAVDREGNFRFELGLREGMNRVSVVAEDRAGNRSSKLLTVTYDITPPVPPDVQLIRVSEPDRNGNVTITGLPGSVEPGSTIVVTVFENAAGVLTVLPGAVPGGRIIRAVAGNDGSFVMIVPLDPLSEFEVVIIDSAGNSSDPVSLNVRDIIERSNTLVGAIKGAFSVDPTGAANLRIPISVPKGAAGMQPDLALLYSSRAGNGQLGVGWSISGLSAITRCPRTVAVDGESRGISYTADDRLCLDGQRLIAYSGMDYGEDGTRYYTEVSSFQRVTDMGDYLKVEDKAGLIRYYGTVSDDLDGSIPLSDFSATRLWGISRIEDRFGNRIDFFYRMAAANREYSVDRIEWYNRDDVRLGKVKFNFDGTRERTSRGYVPGGAQTALTLLLTSITVSARPFDQGGLVEVGSYRLGYETDSGTDRKQLTSVKYCAAGGKCLPPTVMHYSSREPGFSSEIQLADFVVMNIRHIDLDKDGRADSMAESSGTIWLKRSGSGWLDTGLPVAPSVSDRYTFMDYNGDGYLDLVKPEKKDAIAKWTVHPWLPSRGRWDRDAAATFYAASEEPEQTPVAVDWDGDGYQELVGRKWRSGAADPLLFLFDFHGGDNAGTNLRYEIGKKQRVHVIEYNGDGRPDLFVERRGCDAQISANAVIVPPDDGGGGGGGGGGGDDGGSVEDYPSCRESEGVLVNVDGELQEPGGQELARIAPQAWICDPSNPSPPPVCNPPGDGGGGGDNHGGDFAPSDVKTADVNNDGLTDLVRHARDANTWTVTVNTGNGWEDTWHIGGMDLSEADFARSTVADINKDGFADLVLVDEGRVRAFHGDGQSFTAANEYLPGDEYGYQLNDVNTDGVLDVVYRRNGKWQVRYGRGPLPGLLTQFANGYGAQTEILYTSLGAGTVLGHKVYSGHLAAGDRDLSADGRQQDYMGPLPVVSAFALDTGAAEPVFTWYRYFGARMNAEGRGFLGFREVVAYNENSGIQTVNRHRQAFPFTGMVEESRQLVPDQPLVTVEEQARDDIFEGPCVRMPWKCADLENSRGVNSAMKAAAYDGKLLLHTVNEFKALDYSEEDGYQARGLFPYVSQSVTTTHDYHSGGQIKSETVRTVYEDFGNVDTMTTMTAGESDEYTVKAVNEYGDDPGKWCLGRLTRAVVTHSWTGASKPVTRESSFAYDMAGACQLTDEVLEPNGGSLQKLATHYVPDRFGNTQVKAVSGFDGYANVTRGTTTNYDPTGRFPVSMSNTLGHEETYTWDARFGAKRTRTGPNGVSTRWDYDGIGRVTAVRSGIVDGVPTHVTSISRAWCDASECGTKDGQYRVVETGNDGTQSITVYDRLQRSIGTETLDLGNRKLLAQKVYDLRGRVIAQSIPLYEDSGIRCWVYIAYDNLDREVARYTPENRSACGNEKRPTLESVQAFIANPASDYLVTRTVYDGLVTYTQAANGRVQSRTVHANGWLKLVAERAGRGAISPGRLPPIAADDGTELVTQYFYDAQGNTRRIVDPVGNAFVMHYDQRGRKTGMDDPDMGHWDYIHNAFGELVKQTDAKDQDVTMQYDVLGRMVKRAEAEGITRWEYDGAAHGRGKLERVTAPGGYVEVHAYDEHARPTRTVQLLDGRVYATSTGYDSLGRATSTEYPALTAPAADTGDDLFALADEHSPGLIVNYHYQRGRLERVTDADGAPLWTLTELDAAGGVRNVRLGNGLEESRIRDIARGTLSTVNVKRGPLGLRFQQNYGWDAVGNLVSRSDPFAGINESFTYDSLDRLDTANLRFPGSSIITGTISTRHAYDAIGNLKAIGDRVTGYAYGADGNAQKRPHAVRKATIDGISQSYAYDANGSLVESGSREITWSSYNKPLEIRDGGNYSRFAYGPGRARYRHARWDGESLVTTTYVGGAYERIEQAGEDTLHRFNIRAGGQVIAVKEVTTAPGDDTLLGFTTNYLHRDHLGSVVMITGNDGETVQRLAYDPWGNRRDVALMKTPATTPASDLLGGSDAKTAISAGSFGAGPTITSAAQLLDTAFEPAWKQFHRGFTGHEMLGHLGLIHMNGRIYDPVIGRFLSADPFVQFPESTQGYNRYTYVGNNPLSYADPSGYFSLKKELGRALGNIAPLLNFIPGCAVWCAALASAVGGYLVTGSGEAGLKAGAMTAAASWAGGKIGNANGGWISGTSAEAVVGRALAHGIVGGVLSDAGGGRFGDGFLGGMAGSLAASSGIANTGNLSTDMIVGAIVGGTVAEIGGGKFANGAISGAFAAAFGNMRRGSADGSGNEPSDIRDYMSKNPDWADNIEVIEGKDSTTIKISLTVSHDGSISEAAARDYIAGIESSWNTTIVDGGHTYTIQTDFLLVGKNPLIGAPIGDLSIARCFDCGAMGAAGMAHVGGSTVQRYYNMRATTPAHEFGHALGFYHRANATGSIMSYAAQRSVGLWEMQQLRSTYGR